MSLLATYSPRNVLVNYAGVLLNSGRPEDVFITITENAPRASFRKGLSGDTSSALSPDHSATITLSFYPESNTAKVLSLIYFGLKNAEAAGTPVLGAVPLVITEPAGSTLMVCPQAVLMNKTETSLGADTGTVSFEFFVEHAVQAVATPELMAEMNKGLSELGVPV